MTRPATIIIGAFVIVLAGLAISWSLPIGRMTYSSVASSTAPVSVFTHVPTPTAVKAVYMTSWAAGSQKYRDEIFTLLDTTEVNAVVIDVKDYTGHISFPVDDPDLVAIGSAQNRIPDIKEFISQLHKKGAYVIGRISSFQDSYLIDIHPEWAVKTEEGKIWQDYKGVKWLDAGATPVWDYLAHIGMQAYADGFDELNFDYIRFPSDGDLKDIAYSWDTGETRAQVMTGFFSYLHDTFAPKGIPISADLFGLTTVAQDDLGIGQVLDDALPYFDYVAPMVYPSHFSDGFLGYAKPAEHPYEVVSYSMDHAVAKAEATTTRDIMAGEEPIASTTPPLYAKDPIDKSKLRPWLQAFDLGATYTPAMVRDQMQATYDAGLTGWMLWNAASIYDPQDLSAK